MNNSVKIGLILIGVLVATLSLKAQPPGGPRIGGGPEDMIKREKQNLYTQATDLTADQKLLIDGIYDEYVVTLKENFEEARNSGSREKFREIMEATRDEKDLLMYDVLSDDQYLIYQKIIGERAERRQQESGESKAESN